MQKPIEMIRMETLARTVRANPETFDMGHWHHVPGTNEDVGESLRSPEDGWPCGTTHCLAGWAEQLFAKGKVTSASEIAKLLGLPHYTGMFFVDDWPKRFGHYYDLERPEDRAELAAQVVEYYIEETWPEFTDS